MSAQKKQFTATARPRAGKGAARAERRNGRVPAVIYGGKEPPLTISLDYTEVEKSIFAGHFLSTVFNIDVDGKTMRVIPRDYQMDPVKDFPTHVDFLRIVAGSKIRVDIPVHFKNQEASPGLKAGGVINIVEHSIELMCPPDDIPQEVMVDLTGLEIGDSVHIVDIKLPENVTLRDKSNFTVATIAPPVKEEIIAAAAPVAGVTESATGVDPAAAAAAGGDAAKAGDAKAAGAKPADAKGEKKA